MAQAQSMQAMNQWEKMRISTVTRLVRYLVSLRLIGHMGKEQLSNLAVIEIRPVKLTNYTGCTN